VDKNTLRELFENDAPTNLVTEFGDSQFPLIRRLENGKYELHSFFKDFLHEKLLAVDGAEIKQRLHAQFAERYEALGELHEANSSRSAKPGRPTVIRLLTAGNEHLLTESPCSSKIYWKVFPPSSFWLIHGWSLCVAAP